MSADSTARPAAPIERLSAGPIRVKLEEGQLRYLRVGDREVFRRLYFAVRDGDWNTAMPKYSSITVEKGEDHFVVHLAANCKMGTVDYSWTGTITGSPEGKITFEAAGAANSDFDSNRIGLCLLYGNAALVGQTFETDGTPAKGVFPALVSPTLVGTQFHSLRYTTADGMTVWANLTGATFDMEDQRNWGDSSWKAYAPLPYAYKQVGKGDRKSETITLSVSGATNVKAAPHDPVIIKIGTPLAGQTVPKLIPADTVDHITDFQGINFNRDQFASSKQVQWSYTPNTHLPDIDTTMENLPAVADQAKTVRSFNPSATLIVNPLHDSVEEKSEPVTAAWATAIMLNLAQGGVDSAGFDIGPGLPAAALDALRPFAGKPLLAVDTTPPQSSHITAWAAKGDQATALFLINRTAHPWTAEVQGLSASKAMILRIGASAAEQPADIVDGTLAVALGPYGVVRVTIP